MQIFYRPFTDPYLNIAAEEYFIKHCQDELCMIWLNEPSVIIGKHQNAYAEINYPYVRANHIPVIRRISGGGAVYHDNGNVNFTFIKKTDKTNQVNFRQFTSIVSLYMQSLGIETHVSKRNSLFIGSQKFSGHAEHIFHDKVLHHGTILFDTDLNALNNSLRLSQQYSGKAMVSVPSDVCNVAPLLSGNMDIHQFTHSLVAWLRLYYPESKPYIMSENDLEAISHLAETKYKTWQWNFGYSPDYTFDAEIPAVNGSVKINVKVENGRFVRIEVSPEKGNRELAGILKSMQSLMHNEEEIDRFASENIQQLELVGINAVTFSEYFFR